jgi:hypothetical protein
LDRVTGLYHIQDVDSKIARLFGVVSFLLILITLYLFLIRPSQLHWGATAQEVGRAMPGDDLVANPTFAATRAITIRGCPEDIWPWLVQMGYNRAGFHAYDLIENLGSKTAIRSAASIAPELQHPKTGDVLPISSVAHLTFGTIQHNQYLIWQSEAQPHDGAFTWALYPVDQSHTRLVSRIRLRHDRTMRALVLDLFTEFADHVAVPRILVGVRNRVRFACGRGSRNRGLAACASGDRDCDVAHLPLAPMVARMVCRTWRGMSADVRSVRTRADVDWRGFGLRNRYTNGPLVSDNVTAIVAVGERLMADVLITTPRGEMRCYLAEPEDSKPHAGVIVLHDVGGMSKDHRNQADWLAQAGFLALRVSSLEDRAGPPPGVPSLP